MAWTHEPNPGLVFVVNFSADRNWPYFGIPGLTDTGSSDTVLECEFSTAGDVADVALWNGHQFRIEGLAAGEARVYRLRPEAPSSS